MFNETDIESQILSAPIEEIRKNVIYFSKKRNKKILTKIIELSKIDLNFLDDSGYSPLHYSCYRGFRDITGLLLYNGCKNDFLNEQEETAVQAGLYAMNKSKINEENIKYCIELIQKFKPVRNKFSSDKYISNLKSLVNKINYEKEEKISNEIYVILDNIIYDTSLIEKFLNFILLKCEVDVIYNQIYSRIIKKTIIKNISLKKILATLLYKRYEFVFETEDIFVINGYLNSLIILFKESMIEKIIINKITNRIINIIKIDQKIEYIFVLCHLLKSIDLTTNEELIIEIIDIYKTIPTKKFKYKFKMQELFKSKDISI
jgi:hypothetical protein